MRLSFALKRFGSFSDLLCFVQTEGKYFLEYPAYFIV